MRYNPADSTISCVSLNPTNTLIKSYRVTYGPCGQEQTQTVEGVSSIELLSEITLRIPRGSYCYTVTASSGNFTIAVEGTLLIQSKSHHFLYFMSLMPPLFINPRHMRRGVMVIVLSVCVCVCLLGRNLLAAYRIFTSTIGFFMVFSRFLLCGFRWKCFVQEFWCHLLVTTAFLPPWWAFNRWTNETAMVSFQLEYYVAMASSRSSNTTGSSQIVAHWQISFSASYKLLTQHCMLVWHTWSC